MVPRNSCAFAAEASSTPTVTSNAIRVAPLIGTETIRYRRAISKNLIQPMRTSVNLGRDELRDSRGDARGRRRNQSSSLALPQVDRCGAALGVVREDLRLIPDP